MEAIAEELNELISSAFWSVLKMEEQIANTSIQEKMSISELHLLEAVAKNTERGSSISEIATELEITLPSVTVAVNKLEKKGFVEKCRSEQDGRQVLVKLTKQGRKINAGHQYFHENMVRHAAEGMSDDEKAALAKGLRNLNLYFNRKLDALKESAGKTESAEETKGE